MTGEPLAVLASDVVVTREVKKSRFLTTLRRVDTGSMAAETIAAVRKEHWQATHNCTAYIVGPMADEQRSSDDGEPAGTAGVPMLEVLRSHRLTDVVAVVTRYFGGVKLGAGGLVRAYGASVAEAIDQAGVLRRAWAVHVTVACPLAQAGRAEHALRTWAASGEAEWVSVDYSRAVTVVLAVRADRLDASLARINELGSGQWTAVVGERRVVEVNG